MSPTELFDAAHFWGAYYLMEDDRLCKCALLGGSAIGGIRDNNESTNLRTLFKNLKFDQQKFYEKYDAIKLCK